MAILLAKEFQKICFKYKNIFYSHYVNFFKISNFKFQITNNVIRANSKWDIWPAIFVQH